MNADLTSLAQFGFAAVAFWMVWMAYKEQQPRLMEIIRQNAEALQRMASAMEHVAKGQIDVQTRLAMLERQHEQYRECPFGQWERKQDGWDGAERREAKT